jgi:hypothetical protein
MKQATKFSFSGSEMSLCTAGKPQRTLDIQ